MTYNWKIQSIIYPDVKNIEVIVAPEDLGEPLTYLDTVKKVASLKNWHGFDGCAFKDDTELYAALENGTYNGGWFIPPKDLLLKMYQQRESIDGFNTEYSGSGNAHWYWSCTEPREFSDFVWFFDFTDGDADWAHKDTPRLSTRPVRVGES